MLPPRTDPILSRPVDVAAIGDGLTVTVEADDAVRRGLAELNGLPEVKRLDATLHLAPEAQGGVRVTGEVRATVVQVCVVSLTPFEAVVAEPVDVQFLPPAALEAVRASRAKLPADVLEDADDEPDPIINGRIDLGVVAAEHLTLGLDPYPRKPGVTFQEPAPRADDPDLSPFAALKGLKSNTD